MSKWTYTLLNCFFFLPFIGLFWFGIYRKLFFKKWKFIVTAGLLGIVYFFAVDVPSVSWGAWTFNYSKNLGISIGPSILEELIWMVLVFMTVALMIEAIDLKK